MKTICALATARMNSAIHLIRVSGPDAYEIVNKIVDKPIQKENFKIVRRFIVDSENNYVDDVLLNLFSDPKSYTGEDLIEINCHGGVYVSDKILNLLIKNGAVMAQPGEFSQRSLLNKKIDVSQVEAINNLVFATNDIAVSGAINAISGNTSRTLQEIKQDLFKILGQIEVNIDYPEFDDVPQVTDAQVKEILESILVRLNKLLIESKKFIPLNQGIKVAIVGNPNVGKSTLLNALCREQKAIVSDIPGTTRDIVEATINLDGVTLKLLDTAGIRFDSSDQIENLGIQKAIELIEKVDLVLWLNLVAESENENIKEILKDKTYIKVFNKKDLMVGCYAFRLDDNEVFISAKENDIQPLIDKIKSFFYYDDFANKKDIEVLQSQRQINIIEHVKTLIENTLNNLVNNHATLDLVSTDLEIAHKEINKLLGLEIEYDFLDDLFKNFCLGK